MIIEKKIKLEKENYILLQRKLNDIMEMIDTFYIGALEKDKLTYPIEMVMNWYRTLYYYKNSDTEKLSEAEISAIYEYKTLPKTKKVSKTGKKLGRPKTTEQWLKELEK